MVETTILNPQYVYVQATTPTDLTEGKLWFNTSNNTLYTSDGSSYTTMGTDLSDLELQQLKQAMAILILEANASVSHQDYSTMFLDKFSDATGYDNTVDTGNTTGLFSTNKYVNSTAGAETTDESELANIDNFSMTDKSGFKIVTTTACNLSRITFDADHGCTKAYLLASDESVLATANINGNVAEFDNVALTNATTYYVVGDHDGANWTGKVEQSPTYPTNKTNINYTGGFLNGADEDNRTYLIDSVTTNTYTGINKIIQTTPITVTTAQTHHQVLCKNAINGTGSITYDISFDNGSTWDTGQAFNTKNARAGTTGTQMIIKLNLNAGASSGLVSAEDYAVMLWW